MRFPFRHIVVLGVFLAMPVSLAAQFGGDEVRHVIVSVDNRISNKGLSRSIVIDSLLNLIDRHGLIQDHDYLSVLQYSVGVGDPGFTNYVRIPEKRVIFEPIGKAGLRKVFNPWNWAQFEEWESGVLSFSLSSVAKPYSLTMLKTDSVLVNKTYIILVTDHVYNGGDFYQELNEWTRKSQSNLKMNDIMKRCYAVAQEYYLSYIETVGATSKEKGPLFLDLYEFVPLRKDVSFASVFYYPPVIRAERVQRKGYRISVSFDNTVPQDYRVKKLVVAPQVKKGKSVPPQEFGEGEPLTFETFATERDGIDSLQVSAWLGIEDGFYNATLLRPEPGSSPGLRISIPVDYPEDAKVFGIPLSDKFWIFCKNDQKMAAVWLMVILGAIFLLAAAAIFRMLRIYRPKDKHIHLT